MKKNNIYLIVGGLAIVGVALLIIRNRKKAMLIAPQQPTDATDPIVNPVVITDKTPIGGAARFLTTYQDYVVTTQRSNLNVRQNADGNSKVVASLPKGSTIKAKASGVKGWFEVSKDGKTPLGFVSSQFLKVK